MLSFAAVSGRPRLPLKKFLVTASVALLASAGWAAGASASHGPPPWQGGTSVVTPFEAHAAGIATEIAERPVRVHCNDDLSWRVLGGELDFDPSSVWGFVLFRVNRFTGQATPEDYTQVSPFACTYMNEFWGAADKRTQKMCQTGTRTEYRTETRTQHRTVTKTTRRRVKVKGKWVWRSVKVRQRVPVTVEVQVAVQVPTYSVCSDWTRKLFGLETLSHESMHLYGIDDESVAECFGLQTLAWVMTRFGATREFAVEAATDYAGLYDRLWGGTPYYSSECRDGGRLDLAPEQAGWPVPGPGALAAPRLHQMRAIVRRSAEASEPPSPDVIVARAR